MSENDNKNSKDEDNSDVASQKLSARHARKSLEDTNVRSDDPDGNFTCRTSRSSLSFGHPNEGKENLLYGDNKENTKEDSRLSSYQEGSGMIETNNLSGNTQEGHSDKSPVERASDDADVHGTEETPMKNSTCREKDWSDKYSSKEDQVEEDTKTTDNRHFEEEKSLPWLRMNPGDKNLSKQMFLYLTHNELKSKIEDLARRELHACNKQCWDEALRLRDMRNRLELIREKQLYNTENLDLDEEVRKIGWLNISKREAELAERENICSDSTMYSQDAKDLWKKWVHEDDRSVIKDARLQREKLMNSLEKEWQDLAIRDKDRITRTYQNVMTDSAVQEEHKLSAAINRSRYKSFSGSLK